MACEIVDFSSPEKRRFLLRQVRFVAFENPHTTPEAMRESIKDIGFPCMRERQSVLNCYRKRMSVSVVAFP